MRVIRLNDGRLCYLRPARPKIELPPGTTLAFAIIKGQRRSAVRVPTLWESAHEADLRRFVEDGLRERGRWTDAAEAMPGPAPTNPFAPPKKKKLFG